MTLSSPFELPKPHNAQHIGNYVIHKKTLGTGSMGTVKLAESLSPQDHQLYAVKIMPKLNLNQTITSPTNDPKDTPQEREQRTVREMAIMHLLRHPNICQLKEWVVHGDQYYMFLEYVEGGPLLDYIISHGKLREKLARKLSRQIVSALDYCHKNSIVHRDLKIENILITPQQEIKMIDFGLSNIYSPSRQLDTFCGSLYFAAPELLQARHYTGPEVDVWSLGIVMYVLVCGRVPFDDTSLPALHQKIKLGHVDYPDHLSRDCVDLLSKILVVDPTKRATLSQVMYHPWMNKGYDEPVSNHLPHRTPLRQIDPFVVKGMQGFGLGQPEEIEARLNALIHSAEYQREELVPAQRWRLSIRRSPQPHVFQDPFISIYCLVKERQERDAKDRLLKSEGYQSPVQLGRSASTSLAKSNTTKQGLMRRKTERVQPSHTRHLFQQVDWASPVSHPPKPSHLLDRSESAAKRLEDELTLKQKTMNLFRSTSLSDRRKRPEITGGGRMIEEGKFG
ncbi:kinase-like domain-containing protein [Blakeslea trispora]|nr:kinase-like domain-containing protein [Blakeslea trispora]